MLRTIGVSTEVFAAIWANRQGGEETEDAILRRVLACSSEPRAEPISSSASSFGVRDERNRVDFPEGFEIYRSYKHRDFVAVASGGAWLRKDTGEQFATLNQLNASIAVGAENVWSGIWKFKNSDGVSRSIGELRR